MYGSIKCTVDILHLLSLLCNYALFTLGALFALGDLFPCLAGGAWPA